MNPRSPPSVREMRSFRKLWLVVVCLVLLFLLLTRPFIITPKNTAPNRAPKPPPVSLIVASLKHENTSWLHHGFQDWNKSIYVVDDPDAALTTPYNKGREGTVYLQHIIDNYDTLTGTLIFSHASRYQWHNDDPLYDGFEVLRRLQIPFVRSEGYVNLRCVWTLGCPTEIRPHEEAAASAPASDATSKDARAGSFYKEAFEVLFPGEVVPDSIGQACCAQFAVTAEQIKARPKSDYERYRDWLHATPLRDDLSGRILEYSWHIIFGKDPIFCPNAKQCYCKLLGLCDLACEEEGVCRSRYTLPKYSVLPQGWPEIDWDGNERNVTELRLKLEEQHDSIQGRNERSQ